MAFGGAWKQAASTQALPTKWGTGVNPVHAIATEGSAERSQRARLIAPNYGSSLGDIIPIEETDNWSAVAGDGELSPLEPDYSMDAWTPENDLAEAVWGYGDDTGTGDRPRWDSSTQDFRGSTELMRGNEFPAWGTLQDGIPAGTIIRAQNHGAQVSKRTKNRPTETVSEGWQNKVNGAVLDSVDASPDQVYMNTSQVQRDKTRSGSQAAAGRMDDHTAPIRSRIIGMRIKLFSGGERHYDMAPRQAEQIIRPFWSRTAGTPPSDWMDPNQQQQTTPYTRSVPDDPYQGATVGNPPAYGYVAEDVIPYA